MYRASKTSLMNGLKNSAPAPHRAPQAWACRTQCQTNIRGKRSGCPCALLGMTKKKGGVPTLAPDIARPSQLPSIHARTSTPFPRLR